MIGVQTVKIIKSESSVYCTQLAAAVDKSVIDNAIIDEWCGRLRACVGASVGHFEQLL